MNAANWDERSDLHVKGQPFWTGGRLRIDSSVVEVCESGDFAGDDAVAIRKEGIRPLLKQTVRRGKVVRRGGREVQTPWWLECYMV